MIGWKNLRRPAALGTLAVLSLLGAPLVANSAQAATSLGLTTLPADGDHGPLTVFYATDLPEQPRDHGGMALRYAQDAPPRAGNGRLVAISHGSGASPWVQADIARAFVEAGFVVVLPRHRGDNFLDHADVGPVSWERRPAEISAAIDRMAADPRFAPLLRTDRVGVWGMSAGGLTALVLAGGRWAPARLAQHCQAHIADDFHGCVGLATQLRGNLLDGLKKRIALAVISSRFGADTRWRQHHDPRIAVAVSAVPMAAVFDPASFAGPGIPLGLVRSGADRWLPAAFHLDTIRPNCNRCELLADVPDAGHGLWLSPLPPDLEGLAATLVLDPPGFDRRARQGELDAAHQRIVGFIARHLGVAAVQP